MPGTKKYCGENFKGFFNLYGFLWGYQFKLQRQTKLRIDNIHITHAMHTGISFNICGFTKNNYCVLKTYILIATKLCHDIQNRAVSIAS